MRHAWALKQSKVEVVQLRTTLEEEQYTMMLEKEALKLRANRRRMKDQEGY